MNQQQNSVLDAMCHLPLIHENALKEKGRNANAAAIVVVWKQQHFLPTAAYLYGDCNRNENNEYSSKRDRGPLISLVDAV
mmetsp:Transcript_1589/g.2174  ORF Transcript_1589/g.2174 Transcript_1589/m.2174 type:complete len:80 (-) Transcript_1589:267-506(-)